MPVRKYRSVEEMEGNTWRDAGDPQLFLAMRGTWDFAHRVLRPTFPPGIHKHRSIEEANRQRQRWEKANFEAYRARISTPD